MPQQLADLMEIPSRDQGGLLKAHQARAASGPYQYTNQPPGPLPRRLGYPTAHFGLVLGPIFEKSDVVLRNR